MTHSFRTLALAIIVWPLASWSSATAHAPDACMMSAEEGDWAANIWIWEPLVEPVDEVITARFVHRPTGFAIQSHMGDRSRPEFSIDGIHELLEAARAGSRLSTFSTFTSPVEEFEGFLSLTVLDPDTRWTWTADGRLTRAWSSLYGEDRYLFSPGALTENPQSLAGYMADHGRTLFRVQISFETLDEETIVLSDVDMLGAGFGVLADLVDDRDTMESLIAACEEEKG